jgi:hypothetical protein
MNNQTTQQQGLSGIILGINSSTDQYPWQVVGNQFIPTGTCTGAGGQGIGGIGPNCCNTGKQGDTNI